MSKIIINPKNFKAAIFDMDGTMVDNSRYHKKAWIEYLKSKGKVISDKDYDIKISGRNNPKILENIFGQKHTNEEVAKLGSEKEALYRKIYAPFITPVPGLTDLIKTLKEKNIKLGIATTSPELNRNFILNSLGVISEFDAIVGEEHITNSKPHPEIYLRAAKLLKTEPGKCLVFEDSPTGVLAAKNAGMTVIGILTYHTKNDLKNADYTIANFTDLKFT